MVVALKDLSVKTEWSATALTEISAKMESGAFHFSMKLVTAVTEEAHFWLVKMVETWKWVTAVMEEAHSWLVGVAVVPTWKWVTAVTEEAHSWLVKLAEFQIWKWVMAAEVRFWWVTRVVIWVLSEAIRPMGVQEQSSG
jgi:hypothetical protein